MDNLWRTRITCLLNGKNTIALTLLSINVMISNSKGKSGLEVIQDSVRTFQQYIICLVLKPGCWEWAFTNLRLILEFSLVTMVQVLKSVVDKIIIEKWSVHVVLDSKTIPTMPHLSYMTLYDPISAITRLWIVWRRMT